MVIHAWPYVSCFGLSLATKVQKAAAGSTNHEDEALRTHGVGVGQMSTERLRRAARQNTNDIGKTQKEILNLASLAILTTTAIANL